MLELHKLTVFFYFLYCVNGQTNVYGCPPPTSININGCNCERKWVCFLKYFLQYFMSSRAKSCLFFKYMKQLLAFTSLKELF
jgi:hypothetical protein